MLLDWLAATPKEWGLAEEENADGPIKGAALPMGFNRVPHYLEGVMLVGDTGGMVNPFNGEGIAYAMESGELAAEVGPRRWPGHAGGHRAGVAEVSAAAQARYGGYYRLGGIFVKLIGRPSIMRLATQHGLPHPP